MMTPQNHWSQPSHGPRLASNRANGVVGWEKRMRKLTPREETAIEELISLGKKWPKTLMLFSQSGSLEVLIRSEYLLSPDTATCVTTIPGIPNDGGDRG